MRCKVHGPGCVSQMSTPPPHPRDRGGMFMLKNPDDGSPIREVIVLGDRLLSITEKCTYAIQTADQIDPGHTNPDLPHNFQHAHAGPWVRSCMYRVTPCSGVTSKPVISSALN